MPNDTLIRDGVITMKNVTMKIVSNLFFADLRIEPREKHIPELGTQILCLTKTRQCINDVSVPAPPASDSKRQQRPPHQLLLFNLLLPQSPRTIPAL